MLGLTIPPKADGPRDEKPAMFPPTSNAPAAYVSGRSPGEPAVPQAGPSFPFENAGKMPGRDPGLNRRTEERVARAAAP